eukprot:m.90471 g.90471  ORF g.90471 m.90471 type:complete len:400 (+) comp13268_c0_seq3:185-1384(+)
MAIWHFVALFTLLPKTIGGSLDRRVWVDTYSGAPYWAEGDSLPTSKEAVNDFLEFTKLSYSIVLHAVNKTPSWNSNPIMFGIVDSSTSSLRTTKKCDYGDAYFTIDNQGSYGTIFCPGMTTAFWVGHEWGHGYASMAGLVSNGLVETWAVSEFVADVLGYTVQTLAATSLPDGPRSQNGCSKYGNNPGFAYIRGVAGNDDTKRWVVGAECNSTICPARDMWNPECFGAAGKISSDKFICDDGSSVSRSQIAHMNNGVPNHMFALLVDGGVYNNATVKSIGLTKAVRIVFTAVFQGSAQGSRMTFSILASYLKIACTSLQGKELYNLSTGVILNDSINSDDCKQLEFAMDAVELSQPSCQTNPSDATTTTTEAGSSTTTTSSLTILFGATLTLLLISGLE